MPDIIKVDPHRHLGGCATPQFIYHELVQKRGIEYLGETLRDIRAAMQFEALEPYGFHRFLDKFRILDEIVWDEPLIDASIKDVCDGLEAEQIDYTWLDFSINKYMQNLSWHKVDAIRFIHDCFAKYRPGKVGLILSLKYESLRTSQRQYAAVLEDPEVHDLLVGIDLVGDETYFDASFYKPIFERWNAAGKVTRAHVAEFGPAQNAELAIKAGVQRIAHGIKIVEDPKIIDLALEKEIAFDMAVTSNYVTGVCVEHKPHPIKDMVKAGLKITIGSDDPVQCRTTLDREFSVLPYLGITNREMDLFRKNAIEAVTPHMREPEVSFRAAV